MSNIDLRLLEGKSTTDLIKETADALKLTNNAQTRELLRQMNFVGNTDDFVKTLILQFLHQMESGLVHGYKVQLMQFFTMHPDLILQQGVPIEECMCTAKVTMSKVFLGKIRTTKPKLKCDTSEDNDGFHKLNL